MTDVVLRISLRELCQCNEFTEQLIVEVVDHGIAQPVSGREVVDWEFDTSSVRWLRKAVRLHADLEIDWIAVATIIDLLQQNEALQKHNQAMAQQLKRYLG